MTRQARPATLHLMARRDPVLTCRAPLGDGLGGQVTAWCAAHRLTAAEVQVLALRPPPAQTRPGDVPAAGETVLSADLQRVGQFSGRSHDDHHGRRWQVRWAGGGVGHLRLAQLRVEGGVWRQAEAGRATRGRSRRAGHLPYGPATHLYLGSRHDDRLGGQVRLQAAGRGDLARLVDALHRDFGVAVWALRVYETRLRPEGGQPPGDAPRAGEAVLSGNLRLVGYFSGAVRVSAGAEDHWVRWPGGGGWVALHDLRAEGGVWRLRPGAGPGRWSLTRLSLDGRQRLALGLSGQIRQARDHARQDAGQPLLWRPLPGGALEARSARWTYQIVPEGAEPPPDGGPQAGPLDAHTQRVWDALRATGPQTPAALAAAAPSLDVVHVALHDLHRLGRAAPVAGPHRRNRAERPWEARTSGPLAP